MNADEMTTILRLVASYWPNADTERRVVAGYRLLVGDLEAADVAAVLRDLALEGREFAPPPGVVAHAAERLARQRVLAAAEAGTLPVLPDPTTDTPERRDLA